MILELYVRLRVAEGSKGNWCGSELIDEDLFVN